jgi:glycosyltransferase involved in cell wall biosynthesis
MRKQPWPLPDISKVYASSRSGFLTIGEELATAYASSDIFTFPSKSETFGQVVLEAQASGLPVIAFQAEGVCDIVQDGRTGWLVRTGTPEEEIQTFQMGIMAALNDAGKRKYASVEALRWASTWRWSEATEKAVDTYREAILD